jgi:hypothetical protein
MLLILPTEHASKKGVATNGRLLLSLTLLVLLVGSSGTVVASPGGLDARGGHHCWTNCQVYGLYYGQYHCHRAPCDFSDIAFHRAHGH